MMITERTQRRNQRTARFSLECLDDRIVPSAIGAESHLTAAVAVAAARPGENAHVVHERHQAALAGLNPATSVTLFTLSGTEPDAKRLPGPRRKLHALPANVGTRLQAVYTQYVTFVNAGGSGTFTPTGVTGAVINGTSVGVKVHTNASTNFRSVLTRLQSAGLTVTQYSAKSGNVAGMLPIEQLPAVAKISATVTVTLPPNVAARLQFLYTQYEAYINAGGSGKFNPTGVNGLVISGTSVGISAHTSNTIGFQNILAQLELAGLQVIQTSAAYGIINGMLPIGQLPAVANISSTLSITPLTKPALN